MNIFLFHQFNNLLFKSVSFDTAVYYIAVVLPYCVAVSAFVFLLFFPTRSDPAMWLFGLPKRIVKVLHTFIAVVATYVFVAILKHFIYHPRPFAVLQDVKVLFTDTGNSFPSGHASAFAALATVVYFHHKIAGIFFFVAAFLIGVTRIIGGVHYPFDIVIGWGVGILIAYLTTIVWKKVAARIRPL